MKSWWLFPVFAIVLAGAVWVHGMAADPQRQAPPRLTAAEIAALPDGEVFGRVTTDLRWLLVNLPPAQMERWRTLPPPARHVLALAPVVNASELPPPAFEGFAAIVDSPLPTAPSLVEITEAFTAIGATAEAEVVTAAGQVARGAIGETGRAGPASARTDGYASLNQRLRALLASGQAAKRLHAYIRQHADELAAATIR